MKEKIDNLVNKVRDNFSIINKTLKEIEASFVFKGFEDDLPTVEQYSDAMEVADEDYSKKIKEAVFYDDENVSLLQ